MAHNEVDNNEVAITLSLTLRQKTVEHKYLHNIDLTRKKVSLLFEPKAIFQSTLGSKETSPL